MNKVKNLVKQGLERFKLECRINPYVYPQAMQRTLIKHNNPIIFDVGAHHGQTYYEFRRCFASAHIHLVEPFSESIALLKKITANDNLSTVYGTALGGAQGSKTLFVNQSSATNSLNPLKQGAAEKWAVDHLVQKSTEIVGVKTLDSLCNDLGLEQIDILKIDVQGGELEVLKGAQELLKNQSIKLIQFEFIAADTYENQRPLFEYLQLMDEFEYTLIDFYQPLRRKGKLLQCDLLFCVKKDLPN